MCISWIMGSDYQLVWFLTGSLSQPEWLVLLMFGSIKEALGFFPSISTLLPFISPSFSLSLPAVSFLLSCHCRWGLKFLPFGYIPHRRSHPGQEPLQLHGDDTESTSGFYGLGEHPCWLMNCCLCALAWNPAAFQVCNVFLHHQVSPWVLWAVARDPPQMQHLHSTWERQRWWHKRISQCSQELSTAEGGCYKGGNHAVKKTWNRTKSVDFNCFLGDLLASSVFYLFQ